MVCAKSEYSTNLKTFQKIKELGFNSVDLAAFEGWQNINPSLICKDPKNMAEITLKELEKAGLSVCSINTGFSKKISTTDEKSYNTIKKEYIAIVDFAKMINATNITLSAWSSDEKTNISKKIALFARRLKELISLKKDSNISVSVEAHKNTIIEKPENALKLLGLIWPDVGLTYDPSHFTMQGIKVEDTIKLFDYIKHVHLRNAAPDKMQETMKEGEVNFKILFEVLKQNNYDSALSIEYFNGFDNEFKNTLELTKLIKNYLTIEEDR